MYALGLMPLLTSINSSNTGNLVHVTFADDLTGVGKIHELIEWWKNVLHYGPYLVYYVSICNRKSVRMGKTTGNSNQIRTY